MAVPYTEDWIERSAHAWAAWAAADGDIRRWKQGPLVPDPAESLRRHVAKLGSDVRLLAAADDDYPSALRVLGAPPPFLYVRGDIGSGPILAVVGMRAVDPEGALITRRIVSPLARAGVTIVSGGALGVDSAAHAAAVGRGRTVAVLPSGLRRAAPVSNSALFEEIVSAGGALVSEYPPEVTARKHHFRRRNRLIAALADAVLVTRAREKGGTMLTARAAMDLGTPLLAVPGALDDPCSAGSNALLVAGAACVRDAEDVARRLNWELAAAPVAIAHSDHPIAKLLNAGPVDGPELARLCGIGENELRRELVLLELEGLIERVPGRDRWRLHPSGR